MGTSIKINAFKGTDTAPEQWNKVRDYFLEKFETTEYEDDMIVSGVIYCRYRNANLRNQLSDELREAIKGSGVEFHLFNLERDPDESEML